MPATRPVPSTRAEVTTYHPYTAGRVGIIDIGSNSMRLVVYDQLKRAPVPLYNEKVMCQLGKGLASTGRLNPDGVVLAKAVLGRFLAMARNMDVMALHVVATAAVRDAKDGRAFAEELEEEHSIKVEIISGDREARLGAYGVCASIHQPDGITGDLGGGSMELVRLKHMQFMEHVTLPIGPLRLLDETRGQRQSLKKTIQRSFASAKWLEDAQPPEFYAIGGSFRAIARLHMALNGYPLRILHQYTLEAAEFAEFAGELIALPEDKIEKLPTIAAKRAPSIAPAALILDHIIKWMQPERIVFSASGVREGYLFEQLPPYLRKQDALLSSCTDIVDRKGGHYSRYAEELMGWLGPLVEKRESEDERRLRLAFCLLSDIAHHIHPEYRAEWAMQRILQSSFTGISHRERVQLALALYHRYQYKLREEAPMWGMLVGKARHWARLVGATANLAYHLTGGIEGTLRHCKLTVEKKEVHLALAKPVQALMGEAITKRIGGVDEAYRKWID